LLASDSPVGDDGSREGLICVVNSTAEVDMIALSTGGDGFTGRASMSTCELQFARISYREKLLEIYNT